MESDPSKLDVAHYNRNTQAMAEDIWQLERTVRWQGYAIWTLVALAGINGVNALLDAVVGVLR
jgi:hypothetical protein